MKIYHGTPEVGRSLSEKEIIEFLSNSKKNLNLGTIDDKNESNIHPVWFLYENGKIYIATEKKSKKVKNIQKNETVYFSIDEVGSNCRGVRGKATAKIIEDIEFNEKITKKIVIKYAKNLDGKLAREVMGEIKRGIEVVIEITPKYFSVWSFEI